MILRYFCRKATSLTIVPLKLCTSLSLSFCFSAGIGRTGVLITMETAMCLIECNQPIYPLDIVRTMRDQRAMMIQTPVSTILHMYMYLLNMVDLVISSFSIFFSYTQTNTLTYDSILLCSQAAYNSLCTPGWAPTPQPPDKYMP